MTSGDFYDSYGLILKLQHSFKQLQTSDNQEYRYKIAIDQKKSDYILHISGKRYKHTCYKNRREICIKNFPRKLENLQFSFTQIPRKPQQYMKSMLKKDKKCE